MTAVAEPGARSTASLRARAVVTSVIGMFLWLLWLARGRFGIDWPVLQTLQRQFAYKVATGSGLAAFIVFQWSLAVCRMSGLARIAKALHPWHQTVGALAPVLLFLHSTRLGFGYLAILSGAYVAGNVVGLVNPTAFPRIKAWLSWWTIVHIAVSVLLVALASYHAWTALYYE
jgi:methionine sulfoxide reductase heme-binding subunit